ncbi:MAG: TolC family protein [Planctomycetes bacterium]|nr:TolC family protein [Planctomycetota bacterium]
MNSATRRVVVGLFAVLAWMPDVLAQDMSSSRRSGHLLAYREPTEILQPPTPEGGITIDELEEIALANHPGIAEAYGRVEGARGRWVQVGLPPNPQIGYSGQQLGSRGFAEQHGVLVQQEIIRGGKLRLSREVASREILRAEQELAALEQRVRTDVRSAAFAVLVARRQIELNMELVAIAEAALANVEELLAAKLASRIEKLQAQLEVQQAQVTLGNSRNRYASTWRSLTAVLGQPGFPERSVVGELVPDVGRLTWEESLANLQSTSPEIASAGAEVERARSALARARAEPVPNVTVQGIIQRDNAIGGTDGALQVTLPIPILNRNQGGIREAESQLGVSMQAMRRLELDLQNRLAPVFERYDNALAQVSRYRDQIVPTAEENLKLTRQAYDAGDVNYLSLLTAQRAYSQINAAYVESLGEYWHARTLIDGLMLSGSLSPPK